MTCKIKNKSACWLLIILATAMIVIGYILDVSRQPLYTTLISPNPIHNLIPPTKSIVIVEKTFTATRNYSNGAATISKPSYFTATRNYSNGTTTISKPSNFTATRNYSIGTTTISKPSNFTATRNYSIGTTTISKPSNFTATRNYSIGTTTISKPIKQPNQPLPIRKGYCPNSKWVHGAQPENEITIVTAYFNIGSFIKGSTIKFTPDLYLKWMTSFQYLNNPLVVYVDEQKMADIFKNLRKHLMNITRIVVLDRKYMWSFGLKNRIEQIYSSESYPKFHPNTVVPEYSCAQHAKYECLHKAISKDYFSTPYFSWLDIGYFRDIIGCKKDFKIVLPDAFNKNKISFTQVREFNPKITLSSIFLKNSLWVGGGMTIASKEVAKKFIRMYKNSVEIMLEQSLMNTDQQVIYAIYSEVGRALFKPTVEMQLHRSGDWFYLGFLCHRSYNKSVTLPKSSAVPTYTTSTFKPS